jgi:hypothetical protein
MQPCPLARSFTSQQHSFRHVDQATSQNNDDGTVVATASDQHLLATNSCVLDGSVKHIVAKAKGWCVDARWGQDMVLLATGNACGHMRDVASCSPLARNCGQSPDSPRCLCQADNAPDAEPQCKHVGPPVGQRSQPAVAREPAQQTRPPTTHNTQPTTSQSLKKFHSTPLFARSWYKDANYSLSGLELVYKFSVEGRVVPGAETPLI